MNGFSDFLKVIDDRYLHRFSLKAVQAHNRNLPFDTIVKIYIHAMMNLKALPGEPE